MSTQLQGGGEAPRQHALNSTGGPPQHAGPHDGLELRCGRQQPQLLLAQPLNGPRPPCIMEALLAVPNALMPLLRGCRAERGAREAVQPGAGCGPAAGHH
jgi:hypothetical protein